MIGPRSVRPLFPTMGQGQGGDRPPPLSRKPPTLVVSRGAGGKSAALIVAAALLGNTLQAYAQQPPLPEEMEQPEVPRAEPVKRFRLMYLDVSDLREPEAETKGFEAPPTTFRHTFGSQRQTAEEAQQVVAFNPEALEADIVTLRGVREPRTVRRMFPARDWRMLLPREKAADRRGELVDPSAARKQAPAVTMWLQAGVRFGGTDPSLPPGLGVALRMTSGLGTLWALSPSEPCRDAAGPTGTLCKPLEDWIAGKLAGADLILVGGVLPPVPKPKAAPVPASAPGTSPRAAPPKAVALAPRRLDGLVQLTAADAAGRCGGDSQAGPALHLRIVSGERKPPLVAGWLVPLDQPKAVAGPDGKMPPPRAPACALLLDIEAAP
jgi:hypothetical protein